MIAADPEAGEIVCVLDALDECQDAEKLVERLSHLCITQSARPNLKFLLTSTPYEHIRRGFHELESRVPTIHLSGEAESEVAKISQEINLVIKYRAEQICKE